MVDRRLLIPFFFRSFRSSPFFPLSSVISHRSRRLAAPPSHTGHALFFFLPVILNRIKPETREWTLPTSSQATLIPFPGLISFLSTPAAALATSLLTRILKFNPCLCFTEKDRFSRLIRQSETSLFSDTAPLQFRLLLVVCSVQLLKKIILA